jgi:hypothetical protein
MPPRPATDPITNSPTVIPGAKTPTCARSVTSVNPTCGATPDPTPMQGVNRHARVPEMLPSPGTVHLIGRSTLSTATAACSRELHSVITTHGSLSGTLHGYPLRAQEHPVLGTVRARRPSETWDMSCASSASSLPGGCSTRANQQSRPRTLDTTADRCKPSAVMSDKERSAPEHANVVGASNHASELPKSPGRVTPTSALGHAEHLGRRHIHATTGPGTMRTYRGGRRGRGVVRCRSNSSATAVRRRRGRTDRSAG